MAFIKVRKTKPYFKRYQTKFRRRREGKTDYYARKGMIIQDKDKYNTPKYRLVVRRTCTKIICQVIFATIQGDRVLAHADSTELKRFGLTAGLTNYSAAYCTGLLIARRVIKQLGLDKLYAGNPKIDGSDYDVSHHENEERKPFKAILDVGLIRTTNGNRVFGALKGACDGGLNIPHNTRRFPGATSHDGSENYDAKKHRERIFGGHVQKYMKDLQGEAEDYKKQFSRWDACLKAAGVDTLEKLYTKVHNEIRSKPERPTKAKKEKKPVQYTDARKTIVKTAKAEYLRQRRFTNKERKAAVQQRIKDAQKKSAKAAAKKK